MLNPDSQILSDDTFRTAVMYLCVHDRIQKLNDTPAAMVDLCRAELTE